MNIDEFENLLSQRFKGSLIIIWRVGNHFKEVYQGGHHKVFCNGTLHARRSDLDGELIGDPFSCDCHKYKKGAA